MSDRDRSLPLSKFLHVNVSSYYLHVPEAPLMRQKTDAQSVYVVLLSLLREDVIEFPNFQIATLYSLIRGGGWKTINVFLPELYKVADSGR